MALHALAPEVPIVLMSGYDETQAHDRITSATPIPFLRKPFAFDDLRQLAIEVFGTPGRG